MKTLLSLIHLVFILNIVANRKHHILDFYFSVGMCTRLDAPEIQMAPPEDQIITFNLIGEDDVPIPASVLELEPELSSIKSQIIKSHSLNIFGN